MSRAMRTAMPRPRRRYHPQLVLLEGRLPLGESVLGVLAGAALLPNAGLVVRARGVNEGIADPFAYASGSDQHTTTIRFTAAAHQSEAFADDACNILAAAEWEPLAAAFAAPAPRHTSPRREQGMDGSPSLALRVGVEFVAPRVFALVPSVVASMPRPDVDLLATLVALHEPAAPARANGVTGSQEAQVMEQFGQLPLSFEQNVGQTDASVHFFTHGPGYGLFLTATEAVMVLDQPAETAGGGMLSRPCADSLTVPDCAGRESMAPAATAQDTQEPPAVVRMQLVGANPSPTVTGREQQPGIVNYFLGNDPAKWRTNIHTYARVEYDEVYPGIDLVWYGSQQQLEYDFVVSPGADPSAIRLNFTGTEHIELDTAGDLLVHASDQTLRQHKPFVYQDVKGTRQEVASRFVLEGSQARFAVGAYDATLPLVIDPVLSYSTYLGGSSSDSGSDIAVDPASGDALVTGTTESFNFPTANPLQASNRGQTDVFVTRLNAAGSALVFSTYLGGIGSDQGQGIAVDPANGDTLLTGRTESFNFPTANPLQASNRGNGDVFVTRLNAAGSALVFSTYLGGSSLDYGHALAVDPVSGDALVTGYTSSTNFPTANPLQASNRGNGDVFVTRLNVAGSALVYSTYLGGSSRDVGLALAVDPASGHALVTGTTESFNFPTANPLQASNRGNGDVFVTRLNAAGSALVFSTYLGGSSADFGSGLAVDPASGDALLTGSTTSTNFPTTPGAFDRTCGTDGNCNGIYDPKTKTWYYDSDAFVTRIGAAPAAYYYVYPDSRQVTAGVPIDLYVFALDAQFNLIPDYTGLVLFYATDPLAQTPVYHYFQRPNPGYTYFPGGLTFNTPGVQELYVFDWPGVQVYGYAAYEVR